MNSAFTCLSKSKSALILVDLQTKLAPEILGIDNIVARNAALLNACRVLSVPAMFTEQYPKGLGHTDSRLLDLAPEATVYEKIHFNAASEPEFVEKVRELNRPELVITGTEAHVCVLQTSLGLALKGYKIHLCADAIGSRTKTDKAIALERAKAAGISLVTTEMVIFEWLQQANTAEFRALLPTIRELAKPDEL